MPRSRTARRCCFTLRPRPLDPGMRDAVRVGRGIRFTIFPSALALNMFVRRRKLWPTWVSGLAVSRTDRTFGAQVYLSRDDLSPGLVAHECTHALLAVCRNDFKWSRIHGRGRLQRTGSQTTLRRVTDREEWFCSALHQLVNEVIQEVTRRSDPITTGSG